MLCVALMCISKQEMVHKVCIHLCEWKTLFSSSHKLLGLFPNKEQVVKFIRNFLTAIHQRSCFLSIGLNVLL